MASSYEIRAALRDRVFGDLRRLILALQHDKGTVSLSRVAIDILAEVIVAKAMNQQQTRDITFSWIHLIEILSTHCYESGSKSEIRLPIIVARQIVQKGMDSPPQAPEGQDQPIEITEFHWRLPSLTNCIKNLASFAINKGDTEFLYRCLDGFGWLGCSAVKCRETEVVTSCLRALTQLGREVRAKELECFWDRCPVRPEDHAVERIDWIVTWISQMPEDQRQEMVGLAECAYSRFYGKEITLEFTKRPDGKISITKQFSKEKHIEGYSMNAGARDVDYSDFTFLKDLELRSGKGILMQGPVVPFSS